MVHPSQNVSARLFSLLCAQQEHQRGNKRRGIYDRRRPLHAALTLNRYINGHGHGGHRYQNNPNDRQGHASSALSAIFFRDETFSMLLDLLRQHLTIAPSSARHTAAFLLLHRRWDRRQNQYRYYHPLRNDHKHRRLQPIHRQRGTSGGESLNGGYKKIKPRWSSTSPAKEHYKVLENVPMQ